MKFKKVLKLSISSAVVLIAITVVVHMTNSKNPEVKTSDLSSKDVQTTSTEASYAINPIMSNIVKNSKDGYVHEMKYTSDDITAILKAAKSYGIDNPYLPTKGYYSEYVMEIKKEQNELVIVYPHFSVSLSSKEIQSNSEDGKLKDIILAIGKAKYVPNTPLIYIILN